MSHNGLCGKAVAVPAVARIVRDLLPGNSHIPKLSTHYMGVFQIVLLTDQFVLSAALARKNQAHLHLLKHALFSLVR